MTPGLMMLCESPTAKTRASLVAMDTLTVPTVLIGRKVSVATKITYTVDIVDCISSSSLADAWPG